MQRAQINVDRIRFGPDDPRMAGLVDTLDRSLA